MFPKVLSKKAFPDFTSFYYNSSKQRIPFFFSHHHFATISTILLYDELSRMADLTFASFISGQEIILER